MAGKKIELDRPCVRPGVAFEEREDGRFCLSCREKQYDLREATRSEALALFEKNGGRLCGRFLVGPSGELKFRADAPSSRVAARGALLALALAACDPPEASVAPEPSVALPPPSPVAEPETPPPQPPPPTPVRETPPPTTSTGVDTVSSASEQPSHDTDTSLDPAHHDRHWHTHPPVIIGHSERHGGARAYHPSTDDPVGLDDL